MLARLFADYPSTRLCAHRPALGMPSDDDMENSEIGHNVIGTGQVYNQGAVHFLGLFSDINVQSHIDHLQAMVVPATTEDDGGVRLPATAPPGAGRPGKQ